MRGLFHLQLCVTFCRRVIFANLAELLFPGIIQACRENTYLSTFFLYPCTRSRDIFSSVISNPCILKLSDSQICYTRQLPDYYPEAIQTRATEALTISFRGSLHLAKYHRYAWMAVRVANWGRWVGLSVGARCGWSGYSVWLDAWCGSEGLRLVLTVEQGPGANSLTISFRGSLHLASTIDMPEWRWGWLTGSVGWDWV